ncbi:MAG: hypothetical protein ACYS47_14670 [Planctomycetota bacterium]|jgi:hypothetical protein
MAGENRSPRRWLLIIAVALATGLLGGCITGGYFHTHPHLDHDGKARTHRHWHAGTGKVGHHDHPHLNQNHKKMTWND